MGLARPRATPNGYARSAAACALAGIAIALAPLPAARAQAQHPRRCVAAHAEAQRLRMDGKLLAARQKLLACAQRECPDLVTSDCTLWLTEVEASLSSLVLAVEDSRGRDVVDVRVFGNDRLLAERADGRALLLDPGPYEFRFEAEGYLPRTVSASIRQSEKNRILRVRLDPVPDAEGVRARGPDSRGSSIPLVTWVLGGVSLASFGAFAYFGLSGEQEYENLAETCGSTRSCTPDQVEDGKRAYTIANVALGVGIASAVAAAIAYLVAGSGDEPARTAARPRLPVRAGLHGDGAYLQWSSSY